MKKCSVAALAILTSLALAMPVFAGQWVQDGNGWKYQREDGSYITSTLGYMNMLQYGNEWIDGNGDGIAENYIFDENGYAVMGTTVQEDYMDFNMETRKMETKTNFITCDTDGAKLDDNGNRTTVFCVPVDANGNNQAFESVVGTYKAEGGSYTISLKNNMPYISGDFNYDDVAEELPFYNESTIQDGIVDHGQYNYYVVVGTDYFGEPQKRFFYFRNGNLNMEFNGGDYGGYEEYVK